jgi:hypothetical protein
MASYPFARAGPSTQASILVETASGHGSTNYNASSPGTARLFQECSPAIHCRHRPLPKKDTDQLWTGYFIMLYTEKLDDLHGRPMVNVVSGGIFYIYDESSSTFPKSSGWLSLKTMGDEMNHILSRTESKFCTSNGSKCTSKTIGLLVRRHIVAGEFHYIGKEASTRWGSGPDLSMMAEAGALDLSDETFREYERVVDAKYLEEGSKTVFH